jgi:hypothetical protein
MARSGASRALPWQIPEQSLSPPRVLHRQRAASSGMIRWAGLRCCGGPGHELRAVALHFRTFLYGWTRIRPGRPGSGGLDAPTIARTMQAIGLFYRVMSDYTAPGSRPRLATAGGWRYPTRTPSSTGPATVPADRRPARLMSATTPTTPPWHRCSATSTCSGCPRPSPWTARGAGSPGSASRGDAALLIQALTGWRASEILMTGGVRQDGEQRCRPSGPPTSELQGRCELGRPRSSRHRPTGIGLVD